MFDLNAIWYLLMGAMFIGYAVLDGFDLGVGFLHLFTRRNEERRLMLNAIGPIWDGNEVWLVVGIGALLGAFPQAYAAMFSGFYLVIDLLLLCFICRGVAIEFRGKEKHRDWRGGWDRCFAFGSILAPFIFGVLIGNLVVGLPVGADGEFSTNSIFDLFGWYPILVGLFVLSLFVMHGAIYLNLKTEDEMQTRVRGWAYRAFWVFLAFYVATTAATVYFFPYMLTNFYAHPWAWLLVVLTVLAVLNVPRTLYKGHEFGALLNSGCVIAGTIALFGISMFPNLLRSSLNPEWSLTIYNAASAPGTLKTMLIMALIGAPFVVSYTVAIHWVFRGKVKLDKHSY